MKTILKKLNAANERSKLAEVYVSLTRKERDYIKQLLRVADGTTTEINDVKVF
jgi:endonuclease YncB( thermonuclease family)